MSLNLAFSVKDCPKSLIDFPFQTPTDLTIAILEAKTTDDKLQLIKDRLIGWKYTRKEINKILSEIKTNLIDDKLELILL